jgi:hypothetical protein
MCLLDVPFSFLIVCVITVAILFFFCLLKLNKNMLGEAKHLEKMDSEHKFEKEFENISGVNTESKDTFDYVS